MLSLDLSRLKAVAARLGCGEARGLGKRRQLRNLHRSLADRLSGCTDGERSAMGQVFAEADAALPAEIGKPHGPVDGAMAERLRQQGCLDLGPLLTAGQAADLERSLRSKPLLLGRVPGRAEGRSESIASMPDDRNFACYDHLDLWSSPHVIESATRDGLLDLAQGYLGCTPTLCSLNAYWSLPERAADPQVQSFHRDLEDCRSLAVFTRLTPVDVPEEGAHHYVELSHDVPRLEASLRAEGVGTKVDYLLAGPFVAPMTMRLFSRSARRFQGPLGTSFCLDPYGLHRSVVPRSRPQLLLELRFGTFLNESICDVELVRERGVRRLVRRLATSFDRARREQIRQILRRIPATPRHRYIFRHLIQALSAEL